MLVTPSGMHYRVLVLDSNARKMTLEVLRKLNQLAKAGAKLTGILPVKSPALSDSQAEFDKLVAETLNANLQNVTSDIPLRELLTSLKIAPDFSYLKPSADSKLLFVHRKTNASDIYWINNRNDRD